MLLQIRLYNTLCVSQLPTPTHISHIFRGLPVYLTFSAKKGTQDTNWVADVDI
jgi:hypothetical protein